MKKFLLDFVVAFLLFGFAAIIAIAECITQIIYTFQRLWDNIVKPFVIEAMADMNMMFNILSQMFFELSSKILTALSGWSLKLAQICHRKSEKLIDKCWLNV